MTRQHKPLKNSAPFVRSPGATSQRFIGTTLLLLGCCLLLAGKCPGAAEPGAAAKPLTAAEPGAAADALASRNQPDQHNQPDVSRGEVDRLIAALQDPDPYLRCRAITALGSLGNAAAPAVPALIATLKNPGPIVKDAPVPLWVQVALMDIGTPAVPGLISLLKDSNPSLRRLAAETLYNIRPPAVAAIPALKAALPDPVKEVRFQVAATLAHLGASEEAVVPTLTALLQQGAVVVFWVECTLRKLKHPWTIPLRVFGSHFACAGRTGPL